MARQSLELRFGQHLTLTPALQQSIKLLQMSALDLDSEIARALDENPLLEADPIDDTGLPAEALPVVQQIPTEEMSRPQAERATGSHHNRDDEQTERPEGAVGTTLREHLLDQLRTTRVSPRDAALVALLIDDLDDNGSLESSLEEICEMFDPSLEVELDELNAALRLLQSFEPTGIGARDLSECLCLQLRAPDLDRLPALADLTVLRIAQTICKEHLTVLASGNIQKLQDLLGCEPDQLKLAHTSILRLNPRPGSAWTRPEAEFAVPDVIVR